MRLTLSQDTVCGDHGILRLARTPKATIKAGTHEIERINDPYEGTIVQGGPFLVLKGTKVGCAESYWRDYVPGAIIEE